MLSGIPTTWRLLVAAATLLLAVANVHAQTESDLLSLQEADEQIYGPARRADNVRLRVLPGVVDRRDPYRFWKWPAEDALAIVRGFASDEMLIAAGGGAVLMLAARHDAEVTSELTDLEHEPSELLVRIVEHFGDVRSVRPFAGVVFLGSLMTNDQRLQDAAFTSFEAIIMANLVTSGLKTVFGRARPWQEQGAGVYKPFSGNTSFPSGHATTAFAFVTPWLLYYPNAITPGLIVLGAGTAYTRLLTRNHWFTDIVAGSAIGFATAYVLTRRHQNDGRSIVVTPSIGVEQVGLTVSVRMP